jgi:hypothetical protein
MRHIGTRPTPVAEVTGVTRRVVRPRRSRRARLDWGAVGAGLAIASAIQIALALFGRAVGLGAAPAGGGTAGGLLAALGASAVLAVSLYVGGSATGRIAGTRSAGRGTLHGVVLWALSTILAGWLPMAGGGHAAVGALGLPGAAEVPATHDALAGVWLALLGLGVGLTAAVGGVRRWLRRPAPRGAARGGRGRSPNGTRAVLAPVGGRASTPTPEE